MELIQLYSQAQLTTENSPSDLINPEGRFFELKTVIDEKLNSQSIKSLKDLKHEESQYLISLDSQHNSTSIFSKNNQSINTQLLRDLSLIKGKLSGFSNMPMIEIDNTLENLEKINHDLEHCDEILKRYSSEPVDCFKQEGAETLDAFSSLVKVAESLKSISINAKLQFLNGNVSQQVLAEIIHDSILLSSKVLSIHQQRKSSNHMLVETSDNYRGVKFNNNIEYNLESSYQRIKYLEKDTEQIAEYFNDMNNEIVEINKILVDYISKASQVSV